MKQLAAIFVVILFIILVYYVATKNRIVHYAQPLGPPVPPGYDNMGYSDAGGAMGPFLNPQYNNYDDNNGAYARSSGTSYGNAYGNSFAPCNGCGGGGGYVDQKVIGSAPML